MLRWLTLLFREPFPDSEGAFVEGGYPSAGYVNAYHENAYGHMSIQMLGLTQHSAKMLGKSFGRWLVFSGGRALRLKTQIQAETAGIVSHFRVVLPDGRERLYRAVADGPAFRSVESIALPTTRIQKHDIISIDISIDEDRR